MSSTRTRLVIFVLFATLWLGAAEASAQSWPDRPTGPTPGGTRGGPGPLTVVSDAGGDTFGIGPIQHDITSFEVQTVGSDLKIELIFAGNITPPISGMPDALVGFVDLDTDQNPATGLLSVVDFFCPAPAGIGVDYFLSLDPFFGAEVLDSLLNATPVMPTFTANSMSVLIPLTLLGNDDGILDAATVIGTIPEPTDCSPDGGFITSGIGVPTAGTFALLALAALLAATGVSRLRRAVRTTR